MPAHAALTPLRFQSTHSIQSVTGREFFEILIKLFQSTHSIQSVTNSPLLVTTVKPISIHTLHTECDGKETEGDATRKRISIHTLHTECDLFIKVVQSTGELFQSTHSIQSVTLGESNLAVLKGFQSTHSIQSVTALLLLVKQFQLISIHTLHTECDLGCSGSWYLSIPFQSTHSIQSVTL